MKTLTVNVPVQGKIIIIAPKAKVDNGQLDLFQKTCRDWIAEIVGFINQHTGEISASKIRVEANIRGYSAPLDPSWWGKCFKALRKYGWSKVRSEPSPIGSRAGGDQGIWRRAA